MSASPRAWRRYERRSEAARARLLRRAAGGAPPAAPYIPLPAAYPRNADTPAVINSVGIAGVRGIEPGRREAVVAALRGAAAIAVRDRGSSRLLSDLGIEHRLLPDAVHALGVLEPDALERMHAAALADGADIVIGKVVGHGKSVPRGIFRETLHAVPFDSVRLLGLLTPHKLFRRAMLVEHGIRFPEGRRRLEDHLFVVHAYFHANGISVLADRPYYHWTTRERSPNASHRPLDPEGYYGNVREVLDLVVAHTEPGPFRDRLLAHWYRGKMLQRVGGAKFTRREEAHNRHLVATIRALALERYDERVHDRLAFNLRVRSALLRAGRYEDLMRLARFEAGLRAGVKVRVRGGRRTALELTASLRGLEFEPAGERLRWRPPEALAGADLDVTDALGSSHVQVFLYSLRDGAEYVLPGETEVDLDPAGRPVLTDARRRRSADGGGRQPAPGRRLRGPRDRQRRRFLARPLGAPQRRPARALLVSPAPGRAPRRAAAPADGAPARGPVADPAARAVVSANAGARHARPPSERARDGSRRGNAARGG